jgi:hypothetical protein
MLHSPSLARFGARALAGEFAQADLREMTTESRESGRNRIRLTGPKTKALFKKSPARFNRAGLL